MPQQVQLPDGSVGEFPDEMSAQQIEGVLAKQFPAPPPPEPEGNALQRGFDKLTTVTPEQEQGLDPITKGLQRFGSGVIHGFGQPFIHPLDTAQGLVNSVAHPRDTAEATVQGFKDDPATASGNLAGGLGLGAAVGGLAGKALAPVRAAAMGDADAAALKGLQVPSGSPKMLSTQKAIQGSRPFLGGAKSLEDLQARVPVAKQQIWEPYKQGLQQVLSGPAPKGNPAFGTVADLEADRLQTSALLRGLKSRNPEAIQLAQQKGLGEADLLQHDADLKAAIDPELKTTGIDPNKIRSDFGKVAQVGGRISGKSTIIEPYKPYGLGKLGDIELTKPGTYPKALFEAGKDIAAGRPLLRGKPTDVNIKEGFRKK